MPDSNPRTREQVRAAKAHDLVSGVKATAGAREFGRQCLRLPALIHQCGLCQALAFLEAKKRSDVIDSLAQVVAAPERGLDGAAFARKSREAGMTEYQWLTREALRSAQWLKRYCEAILNLKLGDTEEAGGAK